MPAKAWTLTLPLDRNASLPPFLQIARALAAEIERGRFRPGDRLPGSRSLAASLDVHRNTVIAALEELLAEGWIETSPGRGTFVATDLPSAAKPARRASPRPPASMRLPFALPEITADYRQPPLPRGTLNLSNGAPDVRLVPARAPRASVPARAVVARAGTARLRRCRRASRAASGAGVDAVRDPRAVGAARMMS